VGLGGVHTRLVSRAYIGPRALWGSAHWGRGFYRWGGSSWLWITGPFYVTPNYPGWIWIGPQWIWDGTQWVWQEGYWSDARYGY
jgi:hypothetical protein